MRALLDRLQKDAQPREIHDGNTSPDAFVMMVALQVIATQFAATSISERHVGAAALGIGTHWVGFAISTLLGTAKWFDLIEETSIFLMLGWSFQQIKSSSEIEDGAPTERQRAVYLCAFVWCARLLVFVVYRVVVRGSDWRFDKLSRGTFSTRNHGYHLFGWTSGGTWCWVNFFCLWQIADGDKGGALDAIDALGLAVFLSGFLLEIVADIQKYSHNAKHASGKSPTWIDSGAWSVSRHPNYVGEVVLWAGLSIVCANGCITTKDALLCFVSPVWSFFFLFFTSLMLLEKRADAKWGGNKAYEAYKARTPVFL